jgi:hypothetical protein
VDGRSGAFTPEGSARGAHHSGRVGSDRHCGGGEATIPPFVGFDQALQIDEREMVAACQATFKLGIQFTNWGRQGDSYLHPFGNYGYAIDGVAFHHVWHRLKAGGDRCPIQVFNLETLAAHFGKFARQEEYQRVQDLPPMNYGRSRCSIATATAMSIAATCPTTRRTISS